MKVFISILLFWSCFSALNGQGRDGNVRSVDVPEVHELVMVLFALAEPEGSTSDLIDHNSAYYREVMETFTPYRNTKAVKRLRRKMKKSSYHLRMDACNYTFDEDNQIVRFPQYRHMSWGKKDVLHPSISLLEDWAARSGFRQFFREHSARYDTLIELMERQAPIAPQRDWLNAHFPVSYQQIRVFFSPLSYGRHSTNVQFARQYQAVITFVSGPFDAGDLRYSDSLKEGLISRMVFTEIDHNYVNPLSDQYISKIQKAFRQRELWAVPGRADHYSDAYAVFNEYMTWGAYLLYAKERFSDDTYTELYRSVVTQMEERRGFIRFGAFVRQLSAVYATTPRMEILYPVILNWAENAGK